MEYLQEENLFKEVIKRLEVDNMTEVFWHPGKGTYESRDHKLMEKLSFAGVGLVTVSYSVEVRKADHYLLRDDPYSPERTNINRVSSSISKPSHATHYCLGRRTAFSSVTSGERKTGYSTDILPIVYLYLNRLNESTRLCDD